MHYLHKRIYRENNHLSIKACMIFFCWRHFVLLFNHPFMKLSIKSNHLLLFVLNNNISMEKTTYALFHYGFSFFSSESSSRTGVVRERAYFEVVLLICCYCWLQSYFDDRLVSTHTNKNRKLSFNFYWVKTFCNQQFSIIELTLLTS